MRRKRGFNPLHRNDKEGQHIMQTVRIMQHPATGSEIVQLPVRFDAAATEEMENNILLALKIGTRSMILDASNTTYITAAGLRMFLVLAKDVKAAGGNFAVCNLQPQAKELFDACGMAMFIPAYSQPIDAVAQMAA
jgi:anti-anti-sigma factor